MNYKQVFSTSVACLALSVSGFAATVEVNSTLPQVAGTRYQTITAAMDYVAMTEEPRVVNITGGGPYRENIVSNYSVTVRGHNYRPILVTPPTSGQIQAALNDAGVAFFTTPSYQGDQTFRLENLVIIPEAGNAPLSAIRTNNNNAGANLTPVNMDIYLDNVLITSNNGSDEPVSEDGLSEADMTGATMFRDDIIWIYGFTDLTLTNTIITNSYSDAVPPTSTTDGIVFYSDAAGHKLTLGPGCVISYMNRMAIQMVVSGLHLEVVGTPENPVIFKGNRNGPNQVINPAIAIFGHSAGETENFKFENAIFIENNGPGITQGSVTTAANTARGADFTNVAFVNNDGPAVNLAGNMDRQYTFTNVTFVGNGAGGTGHVPSAISLAEGEANGSQGSVTFIDSIIAGRGAEGDGTTNNNVVDITARQLGVTFQNSALVTEGPYELAGNGYRLGTGVSAPTLTSVVNADPDFVQVGADFADEAFLAVSSEAYATAGSGGDPLTGYGVYMPNASVGGWMLY